MQVLLYVSFGLLISGIGISSYALKRYRNREVVDRLASRSRQFTPVWKMRGHFTTGGGFALFSLGTCMIVLGALGAIGAFLFKA